MVEADSASFAVLLRRRRFIGPMLLCVLGLALYLPGINWGLPTTTSWSQDTIAGVRTLGALPGWPNNWQGRYAPFHYLTLGLIYRPILWQWERTGQYAQDSQTGRMHFSPPHQEKIGLLILAARLTSALMAVGAGLFLWAAARRLTGDEFAALLAAVALMIGADFTYFAHLGNVDVPALFWFALSLYLFVRVVQSSTWFDAVLLGLAGSLAISTKESYAGAYPGMALAIVIMEARHCREDGGTLRGVGRAVFQAKWLAGLAAFAIPHLFLCGAFENPDAYVGRLKYWLAPVEGTLHARQHRYSNQFQLLVATIRYAAGGVGWPMVAAMAAAVGFALKRHARVAMLVLLPVLSYYLIVIVPIDFVYSRFLFVPIALLCPLVGLLGRSLLQHRPWPMAWRIAFLAVFLLPSLGYAVAIDLEMIHDSRYDAEHWFRANVDPAASIGAFSDAQYMPRLSDLGYATYLLPMKRKAFDRPQPEYLVLTSYNYEDFNDEQQDCMRALLAGELGYRPVVTFTGRFLGTGSSWLSIGGWGVPVPGKISPTLTVLRRAGKRDRSDY